MPHEINDLLALFAVCLQFTGMAALSLRIFILRRWQTRRWGLGRSGGLVLLALAWLILNFIDVTSVISTIGNDLDDVPLPTTLRIFVFSAWVWVAFVVVMRLAKERLDD